MTSAARLVLTTAAIAAAVLTLALPAGAGSTATCGPRALSQPFARWLDPGRYFLLPGGDFETSSSWTLAGGAKIVAGNEAFFVTRSTDASSLQLPSGSWARTPSFCVDSDEPTLRFFVRNSGSILSTLAVEARIETTLLGVTARASLPLGVVPGTAGTWQPSLPLVFGLSPNQLLGGTTTVDFRFTPVGPLGSWQVDDVYVDPFKDRATS